MNQTTTTDTDALLAEVDALLADSADTDARVEALLATGSRRPRARSKGKKGRKTIQISLESRRRREARRKPK